VILRSAPNGRIAYGTGWLGRFFKASVKHGFGTDLSGAIEYGSEEEERGPLTYKRRQPNETDL
jgi:hypothetical protein